MLTADIHRTFPENIYFARIEDPAGLQRPLINVLTAFALNNPHVGYCQVSGHFLCSHPDMTIMADWA